MKKVTEWLCGWLETSSRLEDIQIDLKMEVKHLQQDVQVRWNSINALPKYRIGTQYRQIIKIK